MAVLRIRHVTTALSLLLVLAAGCNFIEEEYDRSTKKDKKKKVEPPPKKAPAAPPPAAHVKKLDLQFSSGSKVSIPQCFVRLVAVSGRPSVVMVTTYDDPGTESFPAILIKAKTDSGDMNQIIGRALEADIYFTKEANGTVWRTPEGAPAVITIRNVDDGGRVVGSIIKGSLINTDGPEQLEFTGAFDGKLL